MDSSGKILSILIPVFNEAATIRAVIEKAFAVPLPGWEKEIIVVDDGSTDETPNLLEAYVSRITRITHPANRGKGAAIRSGIALARGEIILIQDADLEYDPADWPRMIAPFENNHTLVVYGSRNLERETNAGYFHYVLGGKFLTFLMNALFGTRLTDINTGAKAFRASLLRTLPLQTNGFEFCEEVTAKILKQGITIHEIAIQYRPRTFGEGKKIRSTDGVIGAWTILKNRIFS